MARWQYQQQAHPIGVPDSVLGEVVFLQWYHQQPEPVIPIPQTRIGWFTPQSIEPTLYVPVSDLRWWEQASEPVRTIPPRVPGLGYSVFAANPGDFPSPNTDMRWQQPTSIPVMTVQPRMQGWQTLPEEPSLFVPVSDARWYRQPSEPVRVAPQATQPQMVFVPVLAEIITVDKWYQLPSQPVFSTSKPTILGVSFATAIQENVTVDKWFKEASRPVFVPPQVRLGICTPPIEPTLYVKISDLRWWTQASEPVRTVPPRVPGLGHSAFQANPNDLPHVSYTGGAKAGEQTKLVIVGQNFQSGNVNFSGRIVDNRGNYLLPIDCSSITYKVSDITTSVVSTVIPTTSLSPISKYLFGPTNLLGNKFNTDVYWLVDQIGFNFSLSLPAITFSGYNHLYQVEVWVTMITGESFPAGVFQVFNPYTFGP